jgi:hypothetical protein
VLIAPIEEVLADPRYFPVLLDLDGDRLLFVETTRELLASAPCVDGRSPIADGSAIEVRLSEALAASWARPAPPDRYIFHVAYCGSTLLATLLDCPSRSFALREPNILVDLANAKARFPENRTDPPLTLARALLRRRWQAAEPALCKPSNWANNLVPELTADPARIRPLFLATDQRTYLRAVMRGGRDRIESVLRTAEHLLEDAADRDPLWAAATARPADATEVAARLALVCLHRQFELFEQAIERGGWNSRHLLTLAQLEDDPVGACCLAAEALELDLPRSALKAAVARRGAYYSKGPGQAYSPGDRRARDEDVARAFGAAIDRALDWAAATGLKDRCGAALG